MPEDAIVYSDMTQFAYAANELIDATNPGRWHHPSGFGALGYALPAAIGGKIGRPDAKVIAVAGDYGFQFTMQELGVAAELGLSLPVLLWDNEGLKEIEDSMAREDIPTDALSCRNPDFAMLAGAYGIDAIKPGALSELPAAIESALLEEFADIDSFAIRRSLRRQASAFARLVFRGGGRRPGSALGQRRSQRNRGLDGARGHPDRCAFMQEP